MRIEKYYIKENQLNPNEENSSKLKIQKQKNYF